MRDIDVPVHVHGHVAAQALRVCLHKHPAYACDVVS